MRKQPTEPSRYPGPRYRGPVTWVEPKYGLGQADMFCPRCGSTDLIKSYSGSYGCNTCRCAFSLKELTSDEMKGRRYAVYANQSLERDDVDDPLEAAWDTIQDTRDSTDSYRNLARDYYGKAYSDLESEEWMDDPASADDAYRMEMDVPTVELVHIGSKGYIEGMDVGDEIWVPNTPITIVRTKNSKSKKGKKPFGCGYRR